ncbi:hypothetical protein JW859_00855 [bacterium]|nr:hypothetical protein [bacterium]
MYSNLIGKTRNVVVEFYLRSCKMRIAGKVNEVDEVFVEVLVWINSANGEFAADKETYAKAAAGEPGWRDDRILINIEDISVIA